MIVIKENGFTLVPVSVWHLCMSHKDATKNGKDCAGDGYADLTAKTLSLFLARCHTFGDPIWRQKGLEMSPEGVI